MKKYVRILLTVIFMIVMMCTLAGCKSADYNEAVKLQESGDYASALNLFESISDYENYQDTSDRVQLCKSMIDAIAKYDAAKADADNNNSELDNLITEAEELIAKKETPLDTSLIPSLETSIAEAKAAKIEIPAMPVSAEEILKVVETLNAFDCTPALDSLSISKVALEKSIKQYALVNAPSEAYVIECLGNVEHIKDISAVTEDNDPNGNLNKPGGYTATVYFSDDRLEFDDSIYGTTVIERGTDGGGSVEVYETPEYAEKRRDYLSTFDGTIFASGTHTVIGTVLVRTSNKLKASQQKEMEANLIAALTYVPD